MHILHLSKYYHPYAGGIEQVVKDLSEGSVSIGHQVSVLAINHNGAEIVKAVINGVDVYRCPASFKMNSMDFSLQYINFLRKFIASHDVDVVHIHLPNPLANIALLTSGFLGKIVIHWHSDIVKQKISKVFYKPFQSWLLNRADRIICTSPVYANESSDLKSFINKTTAIPIGIVKNYTVDSVFLDQLKLKYCDKKIIFSLGRLIYYKGFECLIESAKYISDDVIILIGGTGPNKSILQSLIDKYDLNEKVHLVGFIQDQHLSSYFSICDIFCLPSNEKSEAFGVVQIEAFSYGKPVVSCNIPGSGVPWVNRHGTSGTVVPINDPIALAGAVNDIINEPLSSSCIIKYFEKNFDASVMSKAVNSLYLDL